MITKYKAVQLDGILCSTKGLSSQTPIKLSNSGYHGPKIPCVETVDGIDWYQYMVPNEKYISLMDKVGRNEINQKFIICMTIPNQRDKNNPKRRFAAFNNVLDFLGYIRDVPRNRWVFFEYIMGGQIQKLYFDIDIDVGKLVDIGVIVAPEDPNHCKQQLDLFSKELISSLVGRIVSVFNQRGYPINLTKQILIFNSNSETKRSYHLIVDGYAVSSNDENSILAHEILEQFPDYIFKSRIIDDLYSSKQQLRLFHSQKPGSNRPKVFVDKWYYGEHLIEYQYPEIPVPDEITKNAIQFTTLFQASCVTYIDACQIIAINCSSEKGMPKRRHKMWADTGAFDNTDDNIITDDIVDAICQRVSPKMFDVYKLERDKISNSCIYLTRRRELIGTEVMCTLCDRTHSSNNAFLAVNKYGKVVFYCHGNYPEYNLSKIVADVSDLLPQNEELEQDQKQSIIKQLYGKVTPSPSPFPSPQPVLINNTVCLLVTTIPSPITLKQKMRTIAAEPKI